MLFLRASQFLLTRKIFKIFPNWIPILTFLKNCVILTESGVWQAQWDQSCQRWQKSTKASANLSCLFVWGFCISWRYLLHFASFSEGTLYFDDVLHTLQKSVHEFTAYLSDVFYTSTFCGSVSHIILTQLMWRLQVTLAKVNWWINPEIPVMIINLTKIKFSRLLPITIIKWLRPVCWVGWT